MTYATRRLDRKVAIVTGSGKGIGRAEALLMAAQGAQVVVNDIGTCDGVARAEVVAQEIRTAGGEAIVSIDDIATFAGAESLVQAAVDSFGRVDILVNNAGLRAANAIQDFTEEEYDRVLSSHLKATFATIKYATPFFIEQRSGVVLNTGSEAGMGVPYNSAYASAKEGIAGLTRSVARELGCYGVRCNLIRPRASTTKPDFMSAMDRHRAQAAKLGRFKMGRRGDVVHSSEPKHVASLAVWLCTDAASQINGRDFFAAGSEIGLWSDIELARSVIHDGGWTLDLLDEQAPETLTGGLWDEYLTTPPE